MYLDSSYSIKKFNVFTYVKSLRFKELALFFCKMIALMPYVTLFFMPIFSRLHMDFVNENIAFNLTFIGAIFAGNLFFGRITFKECVAYLILALLLYLSPAIYPQSSQFLQENYAAFVWMTMSFYFVGRTIDFERDRLILLSIARLGFLFQLAYQFFAARGYFGLDEAGLDSSGEQMGIAYGFLFCILYTFIYGFEFKSKFDLFLSLFGMVLLLFMGTRGPVICLMVFLVGYFLIFHKYKVNAILKKILIVFVSLVFYQFLTPILLLLSFISEKVGMSNRVFESILSDQMMNLSESNGRDIIYSDILNAVVKDGRGFGYGLGGDRLFTERGSYAHNFEIEILASFGMYIGGAILLLLLILFIKCVMKTRGTYTLLFWFSLFCFSFMSLQFSGTWIHSPEIFLFIGYCVSLLKKKQISF